MPELAPVIAATLSLKFFIDPPADGWLRAQVRAVADSDSTAYLLISKWRVLLRNANVKPGQIVVLRPRASRYQLLQPPWFQIAALTRPEEGLVGKECVSKCRSVWEPNL